MSGTEKPPASHMGARWRLSRVGLAEARFRVSLTVASVQFIDAHFDRVEEPSDAQPSGFLIYAPQGHLRAVVDVKGGWGKTAQWAAVFRRNIMEIGDTPPAEFYLMVATDRIWIWRDVPPIPELVMPTFEFDATPIFASYFARSGRSPKDAPRYVLETIVSGWLWELSDPYREPPEAVRPLREIGFVDALRNARVVVPEAA